MTAVTEHAQQNAVNEAELSAPELIRLLVVDDHAAVRRGLRELFEDQPGFVVVDAVSCAEEAIAVAEHEELDVAVVDLQLPGRNGLSLGCKLKRLANPPRVLVYSAYIDGLLAAAAVVAEADGLVGKGALGSELCDAVRGLARGRSWLPTVPWRVADVMRRRLDAEEQVIFGMSLAGIAPVKIAQTLGISESGLESRRREVLRKLNTVDQGLAASDRRRGRSAVRARQFVTDVPAH